MLEFSEAVLEEARREVAETMSEAERLLAEGRVVDSLMALRWIGEALSGKTLGDPPMWPDAKMRKVIRSLLFALREPTLSGEASLLSLQDAFLYLKDVSERMGRKREKLLDARPHEIKALLAITRVHVDYLLDEYEVLLKR